jgi:hypothetical protein
MGVFLQPDPIGFKGDAANLYRFCSNNAVNRIDPLGLIDSNNFDPNTTDYKWAERANLSKYSNYFTYGGHGGEHNYNFGQVMDPRFRSRGTTIPEKDVIASIKGKPLFAQKSGTLLLVCHSGEKGSTLASAVARGTGKDVLAPSKYLWLLNQKDHPFVVAGGYRDPRTGELKLNTKDPGNLTRFYPDGSSKAGADFQLSAKDANGAIPVAGPGVIGPSLVPTAAQIDAAHQATGVPSLGAEAVNYISGRR